MLTLQLADFSTQTIRVAFAKKRKQADPYNK